MVQMSFGVVGIKIVQFQLKLKLQEHISIATVILSVPTQWNLSSSTDHTPVATCKYISYTVRTS